MGIILVIPERVVKMKGIATHKVSRIVLNR